MKQNLTYIRGVIDKSGSMSNIHKESIQGLNAFIEEQKKQPGEANFGLMIFDTTYKNIIENKNLKDVELLTETSYMPSGMTALLDAIGKTIDELGIELSKLDESERPEKVLIIILTDGDENSSKEYSKTQIFDKIKHQKEVYNWEFIFLAANQDAIATAANFGIGANAALNFASNAVGTKSVYDSMSAATSLYRSGGTINMSADKPEDVK